MTIEDVDVLFRKIKKKFDDDPEGWRVLSDVDPLGNKDLFISQRDDLWQIKSKPVNPFTAVAQGFHARNLDAEIQAEIMKNGLAGDKILFSMIVPQPKENNAIVASGIESFARKQSKKLKEMLGEKHKGIEKNLQDKVERIFDKEHPRRKDMFL